MNPTRKPRRTTLAPLPVRPSLPALTAAELRLVGGGSCTEEGTLDHIRQICKVDCVREF